MQAMVQERYGEAEDVLHLATIDRPKIGDGDVLVRVHAAAVDRGVWHLTAGLPYPVRLVSGLRTPKARVPGTDVAGRVESVGKDVTTPHIGDDVFGIADGSFAQYARARQDKLAPKPKSLSFEQAAAIPVSACTALQAVRDHGRVSAAGGPRSNGGMPVLDARASPRAPERLQRLVDRARHAAIIRRRLYLRPSTARDLRRRKPLGRGLDPNRRRQASSARGGTPSGHAALRAPW